jgi:hypothetical protein
MNYNDAAANGENIMQNHVLEIALESGSILVRGLIELISNGDGI